jgi:hypothetical protein
MLPAPSHRTALPTGDFYQLPPIVKIKGEQDKGTKIPVVKPRPLVKPRPVEELQKEAMDIAAKEPVYQYLHGRVGAQLMWLEM